MKLNKKKQKQIEAFLTDKSSIVCAYTLYVLVTHCALQGDSSITKYIQLGLSDNRGAVKARTRKLIKRFKLDF